MALKNQPPTTATPSKLLFGTYWVFKCKWVRGVALKLLLTAAGRRVFRSIYKRRNAKLCATESHGGWRDRLKFTRADKAAVAVTLFGILILVFCAVTDIQSRVTGDGGDGASVPTSNYSLRDGQICEGQHCKPAALLEGRINADVEAVVSAFAAGHPHIKTLCLRSTGGDSKGGHNLARWLSRNNFDTCLPKVNDARAVCASACTVAFLGGKARISSRETAFGIHGGALAMLINEPPDSFTGEPGEVRGSCRFCKWLFSELNGIVSYINQVRMPSSNESEAMTRLLGMSWPIPAHTIRLLSAGELRQYEFTTRPSPQSYVWSEATTRP